MSQLFQLTNEVAPAVSGLLHESDDSIPIEAVRTHDLPGQKRAKFAGNIAATVGIRKLFQCVGDANIACRNLFLKI